MAKELLIVFVYDSEMCKREEDDPEEAIIYFYPAWVNRDQRHALCSQLMGITQFCNSAFSLPRIISLQSGKFSIKRLSRYYLCVGTDRNIPDIVLESRSSTLFRLLRLFHYDIESLHASIGDDSEYTLTDRLTELFHVYMPILQYATNIFGNIPTFKLPKSASSLFLQAMHILQNLQKKPGVLGGVFLHQNKVIATQFSHRLTKQLVVTDPHRIKLPADIVKTDFHLPVGVQLLTVYVDAKEVGRLRQDLDTLHRAMALVPQWRAEYEAAMASMTKADSKSGKSGGDGEGMKRSKSSMFTVPEGVAVGPEVEDTVVEPVKDGLEDSKVNSVNERRESFKTEDSKLNVSEESNTSAETVPDVVRDAVRARHLTRIQSIKPADYIVKQSVQSSIPRAKSGDCLTIPNVPVRYYSFGLPRMEDDNPSEETSHPAYYNTITDPCYPVFHNGGLPCSIDLFRYRLKDLFSGLATKPPKAKLRPKSIALEKEEPAKEPKLSRPKRDFKLPLNSNPGETMCNKWTGGVALTPLMAKLSMLAMEESVGADTPLATPGARPAKTPVSKPPVRTLPRSTETAPPVQSDYQPTHCSKRRNYNDQETEALLQAALYVYGQGSSVVIVLLDQTTATNPDHVHFLWENCVRDVTDYEERLATTLRASAGSDAPGGEDSSYSYLLVDPGWGPVARSGPYRPHHIELLTELHSSLNLNSTITDITLRTDEAVWYGYQCGGRQVYYQESCSGGGIAGLPPPTDAMGSVPLKARRRLHRDHNILIL